MIADVSVKMDFPHQWAYSSDGGPQGAGTPASDGVFNISEQNRTVVADREDEKQSQMSLIARFKGIS